MSFDLSGLCVSPGKMIISRIFLISDVFLKFKVTQIGADTSPTSRSGIDNLTNLGNWLRLFIDLCGPCVGPGEMIITQIFSIYDVYLYIIAQCIEGVFVFLRPPTRVLINYNAENCAESDGDNKKSECCAVHVENHLITLRIVFFFVI